MSKKYIPEGCWLACNKGTAPSSFTITHNNNANIYGAKLASEADVTPYINIKPMGFCTAKAGICTPLTVKWDDPQDGVTVNGNKLLKEDSTCKCMLGGTIKIYFERAAAAAACVFGPLKAPTELIKEGFDKVEKQNADFRKLRDSYLPDPLKKAAHALDWTNDFSTGLVEGAGSGIASTGEALYQITQDPVGTATAVKDMAGSGLSTAKDGVVNAANWASSGDNWAIAYNGTKDWVTNADNWKNTASSAWGGIKSGFGWLKDNPRKAGTSVGQFIPDVAAAAYTGGGATAAKLTAQETAKIATTRLGREGVEGALEKATAKKLTKEGAEEVVEKNAKNKTDDVIGRVVVKEIPPWKGPTDYSKINKKRFKIGKGREFSQAQKDKIYEANMKHNDGLLRSDLDGSILERPQQSMKNVTPSPTEAQIDHIYPRSKGGTNGFDNAQVLSREQNRIKSDTVP